VSHFSSELNKRSFKALKLSLFLTEKILFHLHRMMN